MLVYWHTRKGNSDGIHDYPPMRHDAPNAAGVMQSQPAVRPMVIIAHPPAIRNAYRLN